MSITFRVITVAIGILVAMVIAVTLWFKTPAQTSATTPLSLPSLPIPTSLKLFVEE